MFISKAEKHKIYQLIAELQLQVRDLEKSIPNESIDVSKAISNEAYRRDYAKKYYWKKKAERLAAGKPAKKEDVNLAVPTTITVTPYDTQGSK